MPNDETGSRFVLQPEGGGAWSIRDRSVAVDDAAAVVARIREESEAGVEVEVDWIVPLPLPQFYLTAEFVLDDLRLWNRRREGWSRPIPIPHLPPLRASRP